MKIKSYISICCPLLDITTSTPTIPQHALFPPVVKPASSKSLEFT
ncbi:predicted protein [Botrytis cinerea T4]|uniref:Uncharacterized protein n=1 Tax=Botryotinia fuckeliana (strain T4) TaxID=999810 RepID=G2Y2R4_BOTF4|nr:predicted protein [Botrytis cinerea T4]